MDGAKSRRTAFRTFRRVLLVVSIRLLGFVLWFAIMMSPIGAIILIPEDSYASRPWWYWLVIIVTLPLMVVLCHVGMFVSYLMDEIAQGADEHLISRDREYGRRGDED